MSRFAQAALRLLSPTPKVTEYMDYPAGNQPHNLNQQEHDIKAAMIQLMPSYLGTVGEGWDKYMWAEYYRPLSIGTTTTAQSSTAVSTSLVRTTQTTNFTSTTLPTTKSTSSNTSITYVFGNQSPSTTTMSNQAQPPLDGFPFESILTGIVLGLLVSILLRRPTTVTRTEDAVPSN
jgi:hypothetical protein